jgi:outer membrane protein assembly factor BamB
MPVGAAAGTPSDWPQFRHDSANTGYNPGETTISASNVARLGLAWTAQTGSTEALSPVVANGVVYVAGLRGPEGWLFAYAASCGDAGSICMPLWKATDGGPGGAPAVANGVVYATAPEPFGIVAYAVGCADHGGVCSPLWKGNRPVGSQLSNGTSPVIANGVVYIGTGRNSVNAYSSRYETEFCGPIWTIPGDRWADEAGASFPVVSPAVDEGVIYSGLEDGDVLAFGSGCLGAGTCAPLWRAFTSELSSQIASASGVVYVRLSNGGLYAYTVGCASGGELCKPLWTAFADSPGYTGNTSSPAVANGVVYVGSTDGNLYAYSTGCASGGRTCTPLWTAQTGGSIESSPAVANGVVYISSDDGYLYAYAVGCASGGGTCEPLWKAFVRDHIIGQTVLSSPVVANGAVYVGSYSGGLYAFSLDGTTPPATSTATPLPLTEPGGPTWTLAFGLAAFLVGTFVTLRRRQRQTG